MNHKRVERLWRQEGLRVPQRQPKRRRLWLGDGSIVRRRAEHRDHVWSYDFVFDRTADGRPLRLLPIVDEYTRECLSIDVGRRLNSEHVLARLAELFVRRGVPEYIRSDNGPEFTAKAVRRWLPRRGADALHRAGQPLGERLRGVLQRQAARRAPQRRALRHATRSAGADGALALRVQPAAPAQLARLPATGAGGHTTAAHAWTARARSGSNLVWIHRTSDPIRLPGHANRCPSEAGMMVCEQPIDPEQGAPVRCDHRIASTGLKRPSTTTAWSPGPRFSWTPDWGSLPLQRRCP